MELNKNEDYRISSELRDKIKQLEDQKQNLSQKLISIHHLGGTKQVENIKPEEHDKEDDKNTEIHLPLVGIIHVNFPFLKSSLLKKFQIFL